MPHRKIMEHEAYEKGWFMLLAMSQGPNLPNQPIQPWSSPDLNNLNMLNHLIVFYFLDGIYNSVYSLCK